MRVRRSAARELGTNAVILMPEDAPAPSRPPPPDTAPRSSPTTGYAQDRTALGEALADGRALIPPYDHPHVIAGQGTAALELLKDTGALDALLVPVGGGLIAGSATATTALHPGIRVIGVEPEAGGDTRLSLVSGARVTISLPRTIADGKGAAGLWGGGPYQSAYKRAAPDPAVLTQQSSIDGIRRPRNRHYCDHHNLLRWRKHASD
ncbi:pyridoxal-phosphate dependent enzyme [Streptomyces sp. NPDC058145]|uniref:pyridoxal-phosphate dependent enzyme n=1 Tax=Streptomyces sp. NPDC058145 TaxID=3346356 RepID=UPI0036E7E085